MVAISNLLAKIHENGPQQDGFTGVTKCSEASYEEVFHNL